MGYAQVSDVAVRAGRTFSEQEQQRITALLDDAAVIIDAYNANATSDAKELVSVRMILRVVGSEDDGLGAPLGATQGSLTAGPYTQSWTVGSGGSAGELYLSKLEKKLLGVGDVIGSYSPVEELAQDGDWFD